MVFLAPYPAKFCCKCYDNRYFYYPIDEKNNYPEGFPEGVESVASTGGQLLPPIMGASAFIMAEFLGVSYLTITKYAILPALLFYIEF